MDDQTKWEVDRFNLHLFQQQHLDWTLEQLAQALKRSISWVKKWRKRFKEATRQGLDWQSAVKSRPNTHRTPSTPPHPLLVERILAIRDQPPDNLKRTPGPRAIAYYLRKDPLLKAAGVRPFTSTASIWKILVKNGRIGRAKQRQHQALQLPLPMEQWQLDYKDVVTVKIGAEGKKAHLVEVLNVIDVGSSILVEAVASESFNAESALQSVASLLKEHGLPKSVTFDRDPRWVGSQQSRDFPSAFVKFWHCLGVTPNLCPPHRPDLNGIVERYHRSFGKECIEVARPENVSQTSEVTGLYKKHYNEERPHQGVACHNQPPLVAFPNLPALPSLPLIVQPDRWLYAINGQRYARKVDYKGTIKIDKWHYYVSRELAKRYVQVEVVASSGELAVLNGGKEYKRLPIKGLMHDPLRYEEWLKVLEKEARSERRLAEMQKAAQRKANAL